MHQNLILHAKLKMSNAQSIAKGKYIQKKWLYIQVVSSSVYLNALITPPLV